jgi:hypothetical protein
MAGVMKTLEDPQPEQVGHRERVYQEEESHEMAAEGFEVCGPQQNRESWRKRSMKQTTEEQDRTVAPDCRELEADFE